MIDIAFSWLEEEGKWFLQSLVVMNGYSLLLLLRC